MIFPPKGENKYVLVTLIKNPTLKIIIFFPHTIALLIPYSSIYIFTSGVFSRFITI